MRVLQINAVSKIKSTGRLCAEIADFLNENGDEGFIAYSEGPDYKKGYRIGTDFEKKMHALYSRVFGLQAYFSKSGTRKLLKYIDELQPDIVHLENLHSNYINLKMLLNHLSTNNIPTVLTLWDCWFFTGKCCHFTVDNCYRWEAECGKCTRLKKDNVSWFFDRTKKMRSDKEEWFGKIPRLAVVGVSDWITGEAKKSLLSNAALIERIYNWIDLDVFKPVNTEALRKGLKLEDNFIILGVASSWSTDKGLDSFIALAKVIRADMRIVMIGQLPPETKLPGNILHIEETHNVSEMVEFYSMADVLVNLSIEETFGLVTAEALACGTPAIVINSTANPEVVGEGCGYIAQTSNPEEIFSKILPIYQAGKTNYSKNCVGYAKLNFSKNERISDYVRVYNEIKSIAKE